MNMICNLWSSEPYQKQTRNTAVRLVFTHVTTFLQALWVPRGLFGENSGSSSMGSSGNSESGGQYLKRKSKKRYHTYYRYVSFRDKLWVLFCGLSKGHYTDIIMSAVASQITCVLIIYSTVCSGADQREHQSSASLAFVRGIHRWPVNSPHKGPVTREMFPFDDVILV